MRILFFIIGINISFIASSAIQYTYVNDTVDYTKTGADTQGSADFYTVDPLNDGGFYRFFSSPAVGTPYNWPERITFETANSTFATPNIYYDINDFCLLFNQGENISTASAIYGSSPSNTPIRETGSITAFNLNTTYFLPMFLTNGSNNYVGWIKIRVLDNEYSIVVESFAYNDLAGGSIFAGEGEPLLINELNHLEYISLLENPITDKIKILNESDNPIAAVIYSTDGELIIRIELAVGVNVVSFEEQSFGVYFLKEFKSGTIIRIVKNN